MPLIKQEKCMTEKFKQKLTKSLENVVHSCPTDKLILKFQKTPT